MKKQIGLLGGTFDPIHFGHIHLALQLKEIHHLDEVLICPAFCSPFKEGHPPVASPAHRLIMSGLAIEGISGFRLLSTEIERQGPSYAIDTVRSLLQEERQIRLLLSEETASQLEGWKEYRELLRLAPPLIGLRSHRPPSFPPSLQETLQKGWTSTPVIEISSTEVRRRLAKKMYCGHLVPAKALDYIFAHHLYLH